MKPSKKTVGKNRFLQRGLTLKGTMLPQLVVAGVAALSIFIDSESSDASRAALLIIVMVIAGLAIARHHNTWKLKDKPAVYIGLYGVLTGLGLIFFSPVGSVFAYQWIVVLFLTSFYFGLKAALGSLMAFAVLLELQQLYINTSGSDITGRGLGSAAVQLGVLVAVCLFFIDTEEASNRSARLLEKGFDKARVEHQRIISLINSMGDAVFATDRSGLITLYNAAALNILDTNEDLTGKNLRDVLHLLNEERKPLDVLDLSLKKNTNINSSAFCMQYPDGEIINVWIFVSQVRVGFGSSQEEGFIVTLRDITREKTLEEERDEFISVISHELRTPVTVTEASISNAQFVLESNQDTAAIKPALETAHSQIVFLANMVNDLSTLSRAERGRLGLDPEQFNIQDLLNSLEKDYKPEAQKKDLSFSVKKAKDTPANLTSNHLYVREILQNFITNAIKYSREGAVTLNAAKHDKGVMFSVKDTGIGISKTDQKKIFDKFYRSEDYKTRESAGTGLGLYITKKLAKIIDAEFTVESQLNKGSTFSVIVPDLKNRLPK